MRRSATCWRAWRRASRIADDDGGGSAGEAEQSAAPGDGCASRRLGQLAQHAHVMSPGHRLADRHRGRPPRRGDALVLAQELLALVAADEREQRPLRRRQSDRAEAFAPRRRRAAGRARGRARGAAARARTRRRATSAPFTRSAGRSGSTARPVGGEHHRREVAAGRMAGDDDARRVAAVLGGVAPDPGQRLLAAAARSRSMLDRRAERVVRQHDQGAGARRTAAR